MKSRTIALALTLCLAEAACFADNPSDAPLAPAEATVNAPAQSRTGEQTRQHSIKKNEPLLRNIKSNYAEESKRESSPSQAPCTNNRDSSTNP